MLPGSIWWLEGGYSLDGGTDDEVRERFPGMEIAVVDIPPELMRARLSLVECAAYYGRS